jgi:alkylation response protein AidB-like acyl-CoA dehydrogenase
MPVHPIVEQFDSQLTDPERDLIDCARDFGRRVVAPNARQWEYDRRPPLDALREACGAGLAAMEVPQEFGGHAFSFSAKARIVEELARFDFGFAFALVNHHNCTARVAGATPSLANRLVPRMLRGDVIGCAGYTEPGHGSDLTGLVTSAERVDGGWKLNGAKVWITNAAVAGLVITLAQTRPGAGSKGLASFIVETDRPGFVREAPYELHGAHAIGAGGFRLEDYLAPNETLLDPPGRSFEAVMTGINGARCYVAAMCAGMLESAIEHAVLYANQREAFGHKLIEFQGLRWSLVDADTDLAALRLLVYRAARAIDARQDATEDAARCKKFAGERTLEHISRCIQAMGANGLRADHPLMRHLTACKTACFTDGTTEMMNERLGKSLSRRYANPSR